MIEREQIIEGLLDFVADLSPYAGDHEDWMKVHRAIKYLKESVKPNLVGVNTWTCGECGALIGWEDFAQSGLELVNYKYCPACGKAVKWDGKADRC